MKMSSFPKIIISGASGFIGRHLLEALKEDYYIYALARRSQRAAGIIPHENIEWIRLDIRDEEMVKQVFDKIRETGGAVYFFHLAAYYDFSNKNEPEYKETNVTGTQYLLENSRKLGLKRFIFASSLTVTDFTDPACILSEKSPADETFPYAISKRKGEELVKAYAAEFPCLIIRQAAIYSDWCEYLPLYSFLSCWLSSCWKSRMLAGKGRSGVPYLHINDLVNFFLTILERNSRLNNYDILIASPDQSTSHGELYEIVTSHSYCQEIKPLYIPKFLALIGVSLMSVSRFLFKSTIFERAWMIRYIDTVMHVDASYTRRVLSWQPTLRYHIKRRLLFLISNMKHNPFEWHYKNEMAPLLAHAGRMDLKIYEGMLRYKSDIIETTYKQLVSRRNIGKFPGYQGLTTYQLIMRIEHIYDILEFDIRTGERTNILNYGDNLAKERYLEGFPAQEVINAVKLTADTIVQILLKDPQLLPLEQRIHHEIKVTLQMVIDIIEDTYEFMQKKEPGRDRTSAKPSPKKMPVSPPLRGY